jgi:hypothetical protein
MQNVYKILLYFTRGKFTHMNATNVVISHVKNTYFTQKLDAQFFLYDFFYKIKLLRNN